MGASRAELPRRPSEVHTFLIWQVHRALEAALRDAHRQRVLVRSTLEEAAAQGAQIAQGAVVAPGDDAAAVPAGTPVEEAEQASECVVCLEEKREVRAPARFPQPATRPR